MILVTGSTGTVGGQLVSTLCAVGAPTRALVRNPEKADSLRGYDCEIAIGDLRDPASLARAIDGADRVFLLTALGPDQPAQERSFVDAARRAGTSYLVKLSAMGTDRPTRIGRGHAAGEAYLRESGLRWTILRPSFYFQNLLGSAATVQEQGTIFSCTGHGATGDVDARDIAAVAAHVLTTEGHDGATYELTGPEALSYPQIAQRLSALLGREVRYVDLPPDDVRRGLLAGGLSEWGVDALLELLSEVRAGHLARVTDEVRAATGRAPRGLEEFLRDHLSAFAGSPG